MLVITRKHGQKIMINDNIVITIVDSRNGQCKIAIEADKDVKKAFRRFMKLSGLIRLGQWG